MAWYTTIFSPIVNGIASYFTERQKTKAENNKLNHELKMAKHNAKVARAERGDSTEANYDLVVLQNAASTIIDEVMIIWVLGLVTCLFIPALAPFAQAGFTQLATVPVYFQVIFVGCFISKLGLRFLFSGRTLFGKPIK